MRCNTAIYTIILFMLCSCNQYFEKDTIVANSKIDVRVSSYLASQNSIRKNRIDTLLTENFIRNINGIEMVSNLNEQTANMNILLTGFPDMVLSFPNRLIKDNEVYVEWIFTGTHTSTFGELTATGKKVKINGITHLYFDENYKIYQEKLFYNELDLLQQLGYTLNAPITE